MTSRNTFQKYYAQEELKEYIETTLGAKALPVASGVFFIFRDEEAEAQFAFGRYRRAPQRERTRVYRRSKAEVLRDQIAFHQELFDTYWTSALEVGRWPTREEFGDSTSLLQVFPTLKQVQRAMLEVYDAKELESAEQAARDNLLFAQAMSFFRGRAAFSHLPLSVQNDIRYFHRTYRELQNEARHLLQSLTDTTQIANACAEAVASAPPHFLEPDKSLSICADFVMRLPLSLRAYVGCAEQLIGSVDQYDLVKLHIHTGKITVMRYDDFANKPLPLLIERIKVSLWNVRVEYFDYVDEYKPRPLYWKSKFLSSHDPTYRKQLSFDERLDELGLAPEHPFFGFSEAELADILKHKGLEIRGHRFYKRPVN
jgi:DNA phosphorothioation-associated putative methyltransferase